MANKVVRTVIDLTDPISILRLENRIAGIREPMQNPNDFLKEYASLLRRKHLRNMRRALKRQVPPRRKYPQDYPLEWTSEKQRKYVWGYILKGKPYTRKNKIQSGWKNKVSIRSNRIVVEMKNSYPESKFVVGLIGMGESKKSIKKYIKPIQRFHTITGWKPAYITVQKYINRAKEDGEKLAEEWFTKNRF